MAPTYLIWLTKIAINWDDIELLARDPFGIQERSKI